EHSLERHDKQIEGLLNSLEAEKDARQSGEDKLSKQLEKLNRTLSWLKGASWAFLGIVGLILAYAVPLLISLIRERLVGP
ncbi:MAG: hypothetical protein ACRD88_21650, partial [Terriglobia bacterium]